MNPTDVFGHPDFDDHEQVVFCRDPETGLSAIIAVHDTRLGPAMGGCRMWPYASEAAALGDALRLARGMSLKNALAELPAGGGKAVILGDPRSGKTPGLLRRFGRFVHGLHGTYVTAEDVGITVADVAEIARETSWVTGVGAGEGGPGGDPAPWTALGVFEGLKAAVASHLGRDDLDGLRVAVQGLGSVGSALCGLLHAAGARLMVADVVPERVDAACRAWGAEATAPDRILLEAVDVVAPCALGAVLTAGVVEGLRASIVAGAANNQLERPACGVRLAERGVCYAPDYLVNAGGIISVAAEYGRRWEAASVRAAVLAIGPRLASVLSEAERTGRRPEQVAEAWALERLRAAA